MKNILFASICSLLLLACSRSKKETESISKNSKPNVILILADDMGWSDIGCFGSEVATPNIDKMATGGMRFTQVYNTAKCFPSRACLLTGQYSQRTHYNKNFKKPLNNAITLGELFKSKGYTTMWSGKHHSTENPVTRGFDHYSGLLDGAVNYFNPGKKRAGEGEPARKNKYRNWVIDGKIINPYTPSKDFYTTDAFTDYALGWLDENKEEEKPFFLYMSYNAPHDPLMAWPEDIKKYKGKYKEGYEIIRKRRFAKQKAMSLLPQNYPLSDSMHKKWADLSEEEKETEDTKMAVYSAMIDRLDQNIGRLQAKLKELKVNENTLIIFVSDNGASAENAEGHVASTGAIGSVSNWTSLKENWANVANTPLRFFKNWSYEGGIKTPMIAYWPKGLKPINTISKTPLHFIDFMATFADLIDAHYPNTYRNSEIKPTDGISFLPLLKGEEIYREKPLFWEWAKGRAVRDGDWKLVSYNGKWELFNLKSDPIEVNDLSKGHPKKVKELKLKFTNWAKDVGNVSL